MSSTRPPTPPAGQRVPPAVFTRHSSRDVVYAARLARLEAEVARVDRLTTKR